MAKIPSSSVTVTLDDSAGTPRVVTSFVMTIGGLKITNQTQPSTAMGDSWEAHLANGIRNGSPIALTGLVDTTADTGTFATMVPTAADAVPGFTRTLVVAVGGSNTYTAEVILTEGSIDPKIGLAEYSASLQPTGSIAWS